jgi:hypothetical protein
MTLGWPWRPIAELLARGGAESVENARTGFLEASNDNVPPEVWR